MFKRLRNKGTARDTNDLALVTRSPNYIDRGCSWGEVPKLIDIGVFSKVISEHISKLQVGGSYHASKDSVAAVLFLGCLILPFSRTPHQKPEVFMVRVKDAWVIERW